MLYTVANPNPNPNPNPTPLPAPPQVMADLQFFEKFGNDNKLTITIEVQLLQL